MVNNEMLTENRPTWVDDHWAAAMAVLATEKALTRFPSGSKRSLTKTRAKSAIIPNSV